MYQFDIETPKPQKQLWGLWPTIGFGLVIFAAGFLIQTAAAIVYIIAKTASNPDLDTDTLIDGLYSNGQFLSIATITSAIASIGLIILLIKLRRGSTVTEYLALKQITKNQIFASIGIFIGLSIVATIATTIVGDSQDSQFTTDAYNTSVWPVLFGIAVIVFAPVFEEIFFRGFLFAGLQQSAIGTAGAIALTSITWAMLHAQYEFFGITLILFFGIALGIVRYKTESLWTTIIIHSLWNLVAVIGTALYAE